MKAGYATANWLLFVTFSILTVVFILWQTTTAGVLINDNIAAALFCIGFPFKIYKVRIAQYAILLLVVILSFQPLRFYYSFTKGNSTITTDTAKWTSVVSPVTFVILMLYMVFNYSSMVELYQFLTKGSRKEQENERNEDINFYYDKFKICSDPEFNDILKMYDDYPAEAQVALNRIKSEKGIS